MASCTLLITSNHLPLIKTLYQAHILPIIDHCDVVWVPTNSGHLKRLEKFTHMFFVLDWQYLSCVFKLTLAERHRFHTAIQIYIKAHSPIYTAPTGLLCLWQAMLGAILTVYMYLLYIERDAYIIMAQPFGTAFPP